MARRPSGGPLRYVTAAHPCAAALRAPSACQSAILPIGRPRRGLHTGPPAPNADDAPSLARPLRAVSALGSVARRAIGGSQDRSLRSLKSASRKRRRPDLLLGIPSITISDEFFGPVCRAEHRSPNRMRPVGGAPWMARRLHSGQGCPVCRPPIRTAERRAPPEGRRGIRAAFLWGTFLWPRKEKYLVVGGRKPPPKQSSRAALPSITVDCHVGAARQRDLPPRKVTAQGKPIFAPSASLQK